MMHVVWPLEEKNIPARSAADAKAKYSLCAARRRQVSAAVSVGRYAYCLFVL
jgi:hypothetical protein